GRADVRNRVRDVSRRRRHGQRTGRGGAQPQAAQLHRHRLAGERHRRSAQGDHPQGRPGRRQEPDDAGPAAAQGSTRGARWAGEAHPRLRQASMSATSPDGQWAAIRRGREVSLLAAGAGPATAQIELAADAADMVIVGPPSVLAIVTRGGPDQPGHNRMVLYLPPYLDEVAQLDLEAPMRIAAITGPRVVLVSVDGKPVTIAPIPRPPPSPPSPH